MARRFLCLVSILFFMYPFFSSHAFAKSPPRRPITDEEIRTRKDECYTDIQSGLWGLHCKSSKIMKENCALRCLSPVCYSLVYEGDPLEEGEIDYIRSQEYKYCLHKNKCSKEHKFLVQEDKTFVGRELGWCEGFL